MSPSASSSLLQWFVDYFSNVNPSKDLSTNSGGDGGILGSIVYEMFGLGDAFGRVMVNNLKVKSFGLNNSGFRVNQRALNRGLSKTRNVSLPGAEPYPSTSSLPNRFLDHGFTAARALTLREVRRAYVDPSDLER